VYFPNVTASHDPHWPTARPTLLIDGAYRDSINTVSLYNRASPVWCAHTESVLSAPVDRQELAHGASFAGTAHDHDRSVEIVKRAQSKKKNYVSGGGSPGSIVVRNKEANKTK